MPMQLCILTGLAGQTILALQLCVGFSVSLYSKLCSHNMNVHADYKCTAGWGDCLRLSAIKVNVLRDTEKCLFTNYYKCMFFFLQICVFPSVSGKFH